MKRLRSEPRLRCDIVSLLLIVLIGDADGFVKSLSEPGDGVVALSLQEPYVANHRETTKFI